MKHRVASENAVSPLVSWRRAAGERDRAIYAVRRSLPIEPVRSASEPPPQTSRERNANKAHRVRARSAGTSDPREPQTRSEQTPLIVHRLVPGDPPGEYAPSPRYGGPPPTSSPGRSFPPLDPKTTRIPGCASLKPAWGG